MTNKEENQAIIDLAATCLCFKCRAYVCYTCKTQFEDVNVCKDEKGLLYFSCDGFDGVD